MSRAPRTVVGSKEGADYAAAFGALGRMIDDGRSFSGHERNRCFLNTGQARFADVSAVSGLDLLDDARAAASVDWDGDGDLDLFLVNRTAPQVRFLRNDWSNGHHWLSLRLTGTKCNRDAIGARVRLYRRGVSQHDVRTLRAGNSFLGQSSKWVHFGLADNREIERVVVRWPGGQAETFTGLEADRRYRLVQGAGRAEAAPAVPAGPPLASPVPRVPPETEQARVFLSARLPLPDLRYETFDGQPRTLSWGEPTLIQLWASWCPMCRAEMAEFAARADELREGKLRVLALSVDGLGSDGGDVAAARRAIAEREFPFPAARATPRLLRQVEILRAELFSSSRPFPVPTCFLVDPDGSLAAIYVGPVEVDRLLADLTEIDAPPERVREIGMPLEGRWLTPPQSVRLTAISRAMREAGFGDEADWYEQRASPQMGLGHCGLALDAERRGDLDAARSHYARALELAARSAEVQNYVGEFFARTRDMASALKRFQVATSLTRELEDDDEKVAGYHYNLARILAVMNRSAEARAGFRAAIRFDPRHGLAHTGLARLLQQEKRWAESTEHLEAALASDPSLAPAHVYLGVALLQEGRLDEAARHFDEALRIDPQLTDARAHLANVLAARGKLAAAAPHYREVLRAQPEMSGIELRLAWCLATCRDPDVRSGAEAVRLAERVVASTKSASPAMLDVLAAAHAEAGDFEKALRAIAEAARLAPNHPEWSRRLKERRKLYESRQPLRAGRPPD